MFFTRSWLYGRSLAVIEVGRVPNGDGNTVAKDIKDAEQAALDRRLRERIAKAALVVSRQGGRRRDGPGAPAPNRDGAPPAVGDAFFRVGEALKGKPQGPTIAVVLPRSTDELWIDSPKLEAGRRGDPDPPARTSRRRAGRCSACPASPRSTRSTASPPRRWSASASSWKEAK